MTLFETALGKIYNLMLIFKAINIRYKVFNIRSTQASNTEVTNQVSSKFSKKSKDLLYGDVSSAAAETKNHVESEQKTGLKKLHTSHSSSAFKDKKATGIQENITKYIKWLEEILLSEDNSKVELADVFEFSMPEISAGLSIEVLSATRNCSSGKITPRGKSSLKDGATSINTNRFRKTNQDYKTEINKLTETQKSIINGSESDYLKLISGVNNGESLSTEDRLQMVNDQVRRVFETYYAKFALEKIFSEHNRDEMNLLHKYALDSFNEVLDLNTPEVQQIYKEALNGNFTNITKDNKEVFSAAWQVEASYERLSSIISQMNVPDDIKPKIMEIYILRYFNYCLKSDPTIAKKLPENHWDIFKPLFKRTGRGRVDFGSHLLLRVADSYAEGILRNFDAAPGDLINTTTTKFVPGNEGKEVNEKKSGQFTRCPDRLEMMDPEEESIIHTESFLVDLFQNKVGTFINGPSGSIMIQLGAIRYFKALSLKLGAKNVSKFLEIQALMFIDFDGGHSMHEIISIAEAPEIIKLMSEAFSDEEGYDTVGHNFFTDQEILEKAVKATKPFAKALLNKDKVHAQLKDHPKFTN